MWHLFNTVGDVAYVVRMCVVTNRRQAARVNMLLQVSFQEFRILSKFTEQFVCEISHPSI